MKTKKYGFHTNSATKPYIMYSLNTALNEGVFKPVSKALVREMRTYVREDMNETSHDDDTIGHWDRLMATAIAWEMRLHADYVDPNQDPDNKNSDDEDDVLERFDRFSAI